MREFSKLSTIFLLIVLVISVSTFAGCDASTSTVDTNNTQETEVSSKNTSVCNHSYAEATCENAKKCTLCGETSGSALGHSYSNATCTEAKKCSRCGMTSGSALGHSTKSGTCSRCGTYLGKSTAEILNDIERYPNYLSIDYEIINTQIELYNINGKASVLQEIIEKVSDMYGYVEKIRSACADNPELNLLVNDCNSVEYPVYSGNARSYLSDVKSFNRRINYLCITYNALVS